MTSIEISADIDQLTFFIPSKIKETNSKIKEIDKLLSLSELMDNPKKVKGQNRYDSGYVWGPSNATIKVMFNKTTRKENMGISVNLTASGKAFLNNVRQLNNIDKISYQKLFKFIYDHKGHISRLDIAIDVINSDTSTDELYKLIEQEKVIVKNQVGVIKTGRIKIVGNVTSKQTIYVGSRQSNAMLRIYNKKDEQTQNKNSRFKTLAQESKSWIRFEAEFKNKLIHKLGEELSQLKNKEIIKKLIGEVVKYWSFADKAEITIPIWQEIVNVASKPIELTKDPIINPIERIINYYIDGGSLGVLWRIRKIFGTEGLKIFESFIFHYLKNHYSPSQSAREDVRTVNELRYDNYSIKPYLKKIHKERITGMEQLDHLTQNLIQKLNFSNFNEAVPLIALWVLIELNEREPKSVIDLKWNDITKRGRAYCIYDTQVSKTLIDKLEALRKQQWKYLSKIKNADFNNNVFIKVNIFSQKIKPLNSKEIDSAYEKVIQGDEAVMFGNQILNAKELRQKLGISSSFFYRLLKNGLPYHQLDKNSRKFYFLDEVETWLSQNGLKPKTTWK